MRAEKALKVAQGLDAPFVVSPVLLILLCAGKPLPGVSQFLLDELICSE